MRETLPQRNSSSMRSPITRTRHPANRAMRSGSGIVGGFGVAGRARGSGRRVSGRFAGDDEQRQARERDGEIEPAPEPDALIEDLQYELADVAGMENAA